MHSLKLSAAAALPLIATPYAGADQAVAQANGCMACHQVAAKVVGPSYKDVAAKYNDKADAAAILAAKVRSGGMGAWGQIPMPPNATISDADLDKVIAWVLAQ